MNNTLSEPLSKKKKYRNDILLFSAFLCSVVLLFIIYFFIYSEDGGSVSVTIDGVLYGTYPLDEDSQIRLQTERGTNLIQILNGSVSVPSADCPDLVCVHHKPIAKAGESIICLPHRVTVTIIREGEDIVLDGISQ